MNTKNTLSFMTKLIADLLSCPFVFFSCLVDTKKLHILFVLTKQNRLETSNKSSSLNRYALVPIAVYLRIFTQRKLYPF